jgi:coenzyme F420-0:L-glutamate ligase/coenzyme F420-1:gamma-L-glutamate ligase
MLGRGEVGPRTEEKDAFVTPRSIQVFGLDGLPEVQTGDQIAELILRRVQAGGLDLGVLQDGDIVVVTSKIVSKAEGRITSAADRESAITRESVRVVASRGATRIVQTRHGFVMAAAGVDSSNTPTGTVLLLPVDPDESSRKIRADLQNASGRTLGVVVSDTAGRPWRGGVVDLALGAAGIAVALDYRDMIDPFGNRLEMTITAVVDEIAAAADLVKGKLGGVPIAIVRGLGHLVTPEHGPGVRSLIRKPDEDLFRLGTDEAREQGRREAASAACDCGPLKGDEPR